MKILSAKQIREADEYSIINEPITSIDLMERASLAFVYWFVERFDNTNTIKVFCGTGNNGGDGLAISRLLSQRGYHVENFIVRVSENQSADFTTNYNRLLKATSIYEIKNLYEIPEIKNNEIVIDGIFGSGLSREVDGLFGEVIQNINQSKGTVVSIDIPSGLFCDTVAQGKNIVNATHTVSFQVPKLAFFLPSNYQYVGCWHIVNIGLNQNFIANTKSTYYTIDASLIKQLLKSKNKNDHKGSNGKALLIV
ncbi:MAG: NAD(P)H-hydrate epimerase, partial [Cyclobacteriaceae bacterium]|nr:NAD(P)H-hydrate epimerase [Cyclobacteriaceae bacterium]